MHVVAQRQVRNFLKNLWICSEHTAINISLDRGHAARVPEEGPGAAADAGQDENGRGAARRLPEAHRGAQGVPHRQGGALQHDSARRE